MANATRHLNQETIRALRNNWFLIPLAIALCLGWKFYEVRHSPPEDAGRPWNAAVAFDVSEGSPLRSDGMGAVGVYLETVGHSEASAKAALELVIDAARDGGFFVGTYPPKITVRSRRLRDPNSHFDYVFWVVVGLALGIHFALLAEWMREVARKAEKGRLGSELVVTSPPGVPPSDWERMRRLLRRRAGLVATCLVIVVALDYGATLAIQSKGKSEGKVWLASFETGREASTLPADQAAIYLQAATDTRDGASRVLASLLREVRRRFPAGSGSTGGEVQVREYWDPWTPVSAVPFAFIGLALGVVLAFLVEARTKKPEIRLDDPTGEAPDRGKPGKTMIRFLTGAPKFVLWIWILALLASPVVYFVRHRFEPAMFWFLLSWFILFWAQAHLFLADLGGMWIYEMGGVRSGRGWVLPPGIISREVFQSAYFLESLRGPMGRPWGRFTMIILPFMWAWLFVFYGLVSRSIVEAMTRNLGLGQSVAHRVATGLMVLISILTAGSAWRIGKKLSELARQEHPVS